jgi:hypothetical protein
MRQFMTIIYSFVGTFRPHHSVGDTLYYVRKHETLPFEKTIAQCLCVFLFRRASIRNVRSNDQLDVVSEYVVKRCRKALQDLTDLELFISNNMTARCDQELKPYSSTRSKYRFSIEIDDDMDLSHEMITALEYLRLKDRKQQRYELSRAVTAFYYPSASLSFGNSLNLVLKAIYESKIAFNEVIAESGRSSIVDGLVKQAQTVPSKIEDFSIQSEAQPLNDQTALSIW